MIQCKDCGFSVNELMRFALMKNICPSCGSSLLSGADADMISVIQSRMLSQRFSSSLTETQVYDISLFIFNELKSGMVTKTEATPRRRKPISMSEEAEEQSESYEDLDESDDLRREVEKEFSQHLSALDQNGDPQSEDVLSKAERLKKLHQQRVLSGGIPESPRGNKRGGFRGVSRSE